MHDLPGLMSSNCFCNGLAALLGSFVINKALEIDDASELDNELS